MNVQLIYHLLYNDLNKYFDVQIISAQEKVSKPEKKIYELLLNKYSLKPEESLFLDDRKENIEAAINCNINGYIFDYNNFNIFLEDIKQRYNINM